MELLLERSSLQKVLCTGFNGDVSLLDHFRGCYVQASMELGPEDVSLLKRCHHFRGCYVQWSCDMKISQLEPFTLSVWALIIIMAYCNTSTPDGFGQNKSVVMHILSLARQGLDLTHMRLPAFILEKRSTLEMCSSFLSHPDIFAA